ncbi:hypothetical protein TNCV_3301461 [Trichonephila clavipes]|nr:hypothetical protein TNCV_3301461 [Trichonephila clavipes]
MLFSLHCRRGRPTPFYTTLVQPIEREITSRVGRNQTTVMRICDRLMKKGTTNRLGRSHPSQCTTSQWFVRKKSIAWSPLDAEPQTSPPPMHHGGWIRVWRHHGERMQNSCVMHRHIGPALDFMVWGGIGYYSRTPLVRIAGNLNSQRYISEVLEPDVLR